MTFPSLISMLSAPIPPNAAEEDALWRRAGHLLAKLHRGAYHTRRRRRKALRRYHRVHHAAGRVVGAVLGAELRGGGRVRQDAIV